MTAGIAGARPIWCTDAIDQRIRYLATNGLDGRIAGNAMLAAEVWKMFGVFVSPNQIAGFLHRHKIVRAGMRDSGRLSKAAKAVLAAAKKPPVVEKAKPPPKPPRVVPTPKAKPLTSVTATPPRQQSSRMAHPSGRGASVFVYRGVGNLCGLPAAATRPVGVCSWPLSCNEPATGRWCTEHAGLLRRRAA